MEYGLYLLLEHIYSAFKSDEPVLILLSLNVSKVFNNIEHKRLIYNLKKKQLLWGIVYFIESFLQGRTIIIKMPEFIFDYYQIGINIPQSSLLSPILYLFYNADLIQAINLADLL